MEGLMNQSICLQGESIVVYPIYNWKTEVLDVTDIVEQYENCYSVNGSVVCFVCNGCAYVTTCTRDKMEILKNKGFSKEDFPVPFTHGEVPLSEQRRWEELWSQTYKVWAEDCESDAFKWSDEHGFKVLDDEVMKNVLRIPSSGIPVFDCDGKRRTIRPICNEMLFDAVANYYIGHFYYYSGVVVFVYRDGHTYLARGSWIIEHLVKAGYTYLGMSVPLSNGEIIADHALLEQWALLKKE